MEHDLATKWKQSHVVIKISPSRLPAISDNTCACFVKPVWVDDIAFLLLENNLI